MFNKFSPVFRGMASYFPRFSSSSRQNIFFLFLTPKRKFFYAVWVCNKPITSFHDKHSWREPWYGLSSPTALDSIRKKKLLSCSKILIWRNFFGSTKSCYYSCILRNAKNTIKPKHYRIFKNTRVTKFYGRPGLMSWKDRRIPTLVTRLGRRS